MLDRVAREEIKRRYYPSADEDVYGALEQALNSYIAPGVALLDAGCGHGSWILREHRTKIGHLVGVDLVPPQRDHFLDEFIAADLESIPIADSSFDIVLCYWVIEHLPRPGRVFLEFYRLLKPGGILIFETPNLFAPATLISKVLPFWLHKRLYKRLLGVDEDEVFPTLYRSNTFGRLSQTLDDLGFKRDQLTSVDHTYELFVFQRIPFIAALLWSRALHHLPAKLLRNHIIGVYKKETGSSKPIRGYP